ncbi:MAG: cytochrome c peroxidase [Winogradskyella sp.]
MNRYYIYIVLVFLITCVSCKTDKTEDNKDAQPFSKLEAFYLSHLEGCYKSLDSLAVLTDKQAIIAQYKKARFHFKHIEPALAYVDVNNYKVISGPNLPMIEEEDYTNIRITEPKNFQVIEEHLFVDDIDIDVIKKNAKFLSNRFQFIKQNTSFIFLNKGSFLKILRNQIVRTGTTGIGGFDSPAQFSIEESETIYKALKQYLDYFKNHFKDEGLFNSWHLEFDKSLEDLKGNTFEAFDRYAFIKNHTHKQMELWVETVEDWNANISDYLPLNNDAVNLFSANTFNRLSFIERKIKDSDKVEAITSLGKRLFNDNQLGQKGSLSCASCHKSELYFTDGLPKSLDNEGNELLRNSPTLFYASLQRGFFHDSRIGGLEGQINEVINNPKEFGIDINLFLERVKDHPEYIQLFQEAFKDSVSKRHIKIALAYYVGSLNPFNSKFDRNIRGQEHTLTEGEKNGFNIFMGKAACATCHFAPVFNGTVPPNYKDTELEVLGVPKSAEWYDAKVDSDLGRYYYFNTEERKHAFKTPTVRNIEKTAPYMHNGVYKTLEEVVRFYNVGGGHGIGIRLENQTLPTDSLHLTDKEQKDLISFMKTLTDDIKNY